MCFGMYNHRFENTRSSMLALKLSEKLKIILLLSYIASHLNAITGKCVNISYVCHNFLQFFLYFL